MSRLIDGVEPLTRVAEGGEISIEALADRVKKTREAHGELLQKYHEVWYNCEHTWVYTHFLGIGMMKCPNDLWMYQQIMTILRPVNIIETGTYQGGSALWFAMLMDMLRIDGGQIFTLDYEAYDLDPIVRHPRISYLHGNSVDEELIAEIEGAMLPGPTLICLDSDHSTEHVHRELELYAPLCQVGDWLVVEDTNIGWSDGVKHAKEYNPGLLRCECTCGAHWPQDSAKCPNDKSNEGARGGLQQYLEEHPNEWQQDVLSERYLLTMNPGGWLRRVGECNHGT